MVGIIILNYNSAEDTIKCIASIEKFTKISYKIYIVEGASKDNSFNILSDFFSGNNKIKIIQTKYNGGYSYGNNLGVKMAIKD
ncbi:MAG: glycosyltransferase, partial [Bacilli bacterium]|nr:glycosyltransferase [Bacilli bacterium]